MVLGLYGDATLASDFVAGYHKALGLVLKYLVLHSAAAAATAAVVLLEMQYYLSPKELLEGVRVGSLMRCRLVGHNGIDASRRRRCYRCDTMQIARPRKEY